MAGFIVLDLKSFSTILSALCQVGCETVTLTIAHLVLLSVYILGLRRL